MIDFIINKDKYKLFILLGSDPNEFQRREQFIQIRGLSSTIENFKITIRNAEKTLVERQYHSLYSLDFSFLQFYTYQPEDEYLVELSFDNIRKSFIVIV